MAEPTSVDKSPTPTPASTQRDDLPRHIEQHFAETQRAARIGSFEWNVETNEIWSSDETYRLYDLEPGQFKLTYEKFIRTIRDEFREEVERTLRRAVQKALPCDIVFPYETRLGQERWMRVTGKLLPGRTGQAARLVGTAQDLTSLRSAQESLQRAKTEHLQYQEACERILEHHPDYIVRFDESGAICYVNPAYCKASGHSREELLGRSMREFTLATHNDGILRRLRQLTPENPMISSENEITRSDGSRSWVQWIDTAIMFDVNEHPIMYQSCGRDITDHISVENELKSSLSVIQSLESELRQENEALRQEFASLKGKKDLIGHSPPMEEIRHAVSKVSGTDMSVLLMGETGSGKEVVAETIHHQSERRDKPLIKVNCAALSSQLVESELFGHMKGAFTGATSNRKGRFELAHNTTLFLDEIGELSLETQAKLLRVLEDGSLERLGSSETMHVDVRVIAATNRELMDQVEHGRFREDLLWRLNVFPIRVPPLRARRDDIAELTEHFLAEIHHKYGLAATSLEPDALEALMSYSWPGNIRQLKHVLERAAIVASGNRITQADIELPDEQPPARGNDSLDSVLHDHIIRTLKECNGVIGGKDGAATRLGINESTLRSRMKKLGIEPGNRRKPPA